MPTMSRVLDMRTTVDITPEQYFSGTDPQLDKAIDVLMGKVK